MTVNQPQKRVDPARQAGALVLGTALATVASALSPLLIVRLLGKADVAELLSVTLAYETAAMLLGAGLPYTLLYQASNREPPERAAVARHMVRVAAALGAAGAVLVGLVALVVYPDPFGLAPPELVRTQLRLMSWLAPSLVAELPARLLPNLLVVEGQARRAAGFQVVRTLALTLSTLVPLALGSSVDIVILWYAIARWGFGLFTLGELRRLYRDVARVPPPLGVKQVFRFAVPIGATDALGALNAQLDRWLILLVLPGALLADYQAGAFQVPVIGSIAGSVAQAYTPELVKRFQAGDPYGALALWQQGIKKTALVVVPVTMALVVGARELMALLFTREYVNAASIFQWYSVLSFLRVGGFGAVIVAAGRPDLVVRAAGLGLLYNLLFSVPLVLTLGFQGPALGTALAFVLHVATYVYYIARSAGVPVLRVFPLVQYARIFALASVAGALGFAVKSLLSARPTLALGVEIVTVLAVFALLGTLTRTIQRSDWSYARDWLRLKVLR